MGIDDVRWFRVRQYLLIGLELVAGSLDIWLEYVSTVGCGALVDRRSASRSARS